MRPRCLPERRQYPIAKIRRFLPCSIRRSLGRTYQAFHVNVFRQVSEIALERIRNPATVFHNPAFANTLVHLFAEHVIDQLVEVGIVRKNDVPTFVPNKAVRVDVRGRMSADTVRFFVQHPVLIAEFVKPIGGAQAGWARSDHDDLFVRHNFLSRG
jgi:hypothetical protein